MWRTDRRPQGRSDAAGPHGFPLQEETSDSESESDCHNLSTSSCPQRTLGEVVGRVTLRATNEEMVRWSDKPGIYTKMPTKNGKSWRRKQSTNACEGNKGSSAKLAGNLRLNS